jgi:hypothetical protein
MKEKSFIGAIEAHQFQVNVYGHRACNVKGIAQ